MMFVSAQALSTAQALYSDVKARAEKFGRDPRHIKIMPGLAITLGRTEIRGQREIRGSFSSLLT